MESDSLNSCSVTLFQLHTIPKTDWVRMASGKVCLVSALCSFIIITICISSTESVSCCLGYSKHPPHLNRILGYSVQTITGSCDIDAIVFRLQNKFVCADPSKDWTQKAMKIIDVRRKKTNQLLKGKH